MLRGGFVAEILRLDQRRLVAARDAVAAEDVVAGDLVGLRRLADHDAVILGHRGQGLVGLGVIVVARCP